MERAVYVALCGALEPLLQLHLRCRKWRGFEHPTRWKERLGYPSADRPSGALIWFHAVSLGEGLAAIPIINKCLQMQPLLNILLTTGTLTAFYTLKCNLPQTVLCQSTVDAVRFQILGASPAVIHFPGNSKYAWGTFDKRVEVEEMLKHAGREVWLASSTHAGEEEVIARVHLLLKQRFPNLLTVIAPRHPRRAKTILTMLRNKGLKTAQRSSNHQISHDTDVYLADTTGELKKLYSSVPVAFVGGSLLPDLKGHNLAEAAACGCAVLTGPFLGHFIKMLKEMQSISTLSIQQVRSEDGLVNALAELFLDSDALQSRREAAKSASISSAAGVVESIYKLLELYIFSQEKSASLGRSTEQQKRMNDTSAACISSQ